MIEVVIPDPHIVAINRMKRKLDKKTKTIASLKELIAKLEHVLANKALDDLTFERRVERAVTNALCNVRMIPVLGVGQTSKIVEITSKDA